MPWTAAYDADLRVVLEDCWLSNSSAPERPGAPRIPLMRKSCPHDSSIDLEPEQYHSPTSGFSFQVCPHDEHIIPCFICIWIFLFFSSWKQNGNRTKRVFSD